MSAREKVARAELAETESERRKCVSVRDETREEMEISRTAEGESRNEVKAA